MKKILELGAWWAFVVLIVAGGFVLSGTAHATVTYQAAGDSSWYSTPGDACLQRGLSTGHSSGRVMLSGATCASAGTFGCCEYQYAGSWLANNATITSQGEPEPECPASGTVFSSGLYVGTAESPQRSGCDGGCTTVFSGGLQGRVISGGQYVYYWAGAFKYAGVVETCTSGDPSVGVTGSLPAPTCGTGQTLGTINGVPQCFTTATGLPVNPNTGASSSGPTSTVQADTPSSGQTTTTTTGADGTVRTVVKDAAGATVSDTTTGGDPLKPFCEQNPKSPVCSKSSFGGTCGAGFTCEGDAAECAVAQELYRRNCTLFDAATTLSDLGNAAAAGTDSGTTGNPALTANRVSTDLTTLLSQSRWLSSSALSDITLTFPTMHGYTMSVSAPFSQFNTILAWLGNLLVALALIGAVRYVFS